MTFFGPTSLQFEQVEQGFGKFGAQVLVVAEFAGAGEFVELLLEGVADALDALEFVVARQLDDVAGVTLDDVGAVAVGADLEGVFAFQFEKLGDVLENFDEVVAGQISRR